MEREVAGGTWDKRVKFDVPSCSAANSTSKVETGGGGQEEEEEADVKMNEEKDPEEEHEDNGDYEVEPSPTKRGVKGKRKGKGEGKVGRPKKVKVAPAPPVVVTPTTATVGEEDVTVKINNVVVPLRSPISASAEADDGSEEEEGGDGEVTTTNGKEHKKQRWKWDVDVPLGSSDLELVEKAGAIWKVYVDRNFLLDGPQASSRVVFPLSWCSVLRWAFDLSTSSIVHPSPHQPAFSFFLRSVSHVLSFMRSHLTLQSDCAYFILRLIIQRGELLRETRFSGRAAIASNKGM